jgi:hypothetical protein
MSAVFLKPCGRGVLAPTISCPENVTPARLSILSISNSEGDKNLQLVGPAGSNTLAFTASLTATGEIGDREPTLGD